MKKVLNGKLYDTNTAKCVGSWDNGLYGRDFNRLSEDLYRKRTGEFFLHGSGGPLTQYAEWHGDNERSGGERIIPLSLEAAQEWAEERLTGEEYEAIFGEVEEGPENLYLGGMPPEVAAKIRQEAKELGISLAEVVARRFAF